jgi:hypothetical protein
MKKDETIRAMTQKFTVNLHHHATSANVLEAETNIHNLQILASIKNKITMREGLKRHIQSGLNLPKRAALS